MIIRNEHKKQFTKVDTELARNGTFRPEELGLYVAMLTHTDNWDFHEKALSRELCTTPEEIRSILVRLEMKGFAVSRTSRYGTTWDLIEKPDEVSNDDDFPPQEEDGIWLIKQPHFDAEQDCEASEDGVGQKLIAFAQQMRRDAAAQKTGASGLPNANG
ncbi:MAG: hypothetical protein IKZ44_01255 [Clostridia bacterium]|nr:hypothetical protein [Clostridia bacterium]